jgi:hypothetical protein
MAGNDFEIKKKFAWKTGILQQVTEVRATLVMRRRAGNPSPDSPVRIALKRSP